MLTVNSGCVAGEGEGVIVGLVAIVGLVVFVGLVSRVGVESSVGVLVGCVVASVVSVG